MQAEIDAVRVVGTEDGPVPVVVLAPEGGGEEALPIFIGFEEALSITRGLSANGIGRPLTHDLLLDVVGELGGYLSRVVVSAVVDNTYIADVHIETPRGSEAVVDARPSDSLALAARVDAAIEIHPDVFEEGRRPRRDFEELDELEDVVELK